MTTATLEPRPSLAPLEVRHVPFGDIPRAAWERLAQATPAVTPFSSWTFQRAWWDAYAETAEDRSLVVVPAGDGQPLVAERQAGAVADIRAILPLMVRADPVRGRELFMGASYHADYATLLALPADLDASVAVLLQRLGPAPTGWLGDAVDVVDLRRLRTSDPVLPLLHAALEAVCAGSGWQVERLQEDVCPVVTLAESWEAQLARMSKRARHEVRRKLRRAERNGPLVFRPLSLEAASVERFIGLHQARFGDRGLFARTPDGDRSRTFLHRFAQLQAQADPERTLQIAEVLVGDATVQAVVGLDDGTTCYYYNAGMDPAYMDLSPGVLGTAAYLRDRIEAGRRRFDFLRGNETYKYEWGARDEVIERIVARRSA